MIVWDDTIRPQQKKKRFLDISMTPRLEPLVSHWGASWAKKTHSRGRSVVEDLENQNAKLSKVILCQLWIWRGYRLVFQWVGYGWISLQLHLNHCPTIEKFQLVGKNREAPQNDSTINPESQVVWSAPSNTRHGLCFPIGSLSTWTADPVETSKGSCPQMFFCLGQKRAHRVERNHKITYWTTGQYFKVFIIQVHLDKTCLYVSVFF